MQRFPECTPDKNPKDHAMHRKIFYRKDATTQTWFSAVPEENETNET